MVSDVCGRRYDCGVLYVFLLTAKSVPADRRFVVGSNLGDMRISLYSFNVSL